MLLVSALPSVQPRRLCMVCTLLFVVAAALLATTPHATIAAEPLPSLILAGVDPLFTLTDQDCTLSTSQLVARDAMRGSFKVNQQSIDKLWQLAVDEDVLVVSVMGPARSGKSFLEDLLVGAIGMEVSDSTEAQTMGIWMWDCLLSLPDGTRVILLDVEGINQGKAHDQLLITIASRISDHIIFNKKGEFDQSSVDDLVDFLQLSSLDLVDTISNQDNHTGLFDKPQLTVLLRDFSLQFQNGESATDFIHRRIRETHDNQVCSTRTDAESEDGSADGDDQGDHREGQACFGSSLDKYFSGIHGSTMAAPASVDIQDVRSGYLGEKFVDDFALFQDQLSASLSAQAHGGDRKGRPVPMFIALVATVVDSIQQGHYKDFVSIMSALKYENFLEHLTREKKKKAKKELAALNAFNEPIEEAIFDSNSSMVLNQALSFPAGFAESNKNAWTDAVRRLRTDLVAYRDEQKEKYVLEAKEYIRNAFGRMLGETRLELQAQFPLPSPQAMEIVTTALDSLKASCEEAFSSFSTAWHDVSPNALGQIDSTNSSLLHINNEDIRTLLETESSRIPMHVRALVDELYVGAPERLFTRVEAEEALAAMTQDGQEYYVSLVSQYQDEIAFAKYFGDVKAEIASILLTWQNRNDEAVQNFVKGQVMKAQSACSQMLTRIDLPDDETLTERLAEVLDEVSSTFNDATNTFSDVNGVPALIEELQASLRTMVNAKEEENTNLFKQLVEKEIRAVSVQLDDMDNEFWYLDSFVAEVKKRITAELMTKILPNGRPMKESTITKVVERWMALDEGVQGIVKRKNMYKNILMALLAMALAYATFKAMRWERPAALSAKGSAPKVKFER